MRPNGETDAVISDGAARLGGPRIPRDVVGGGCLVKDRRGTEECGRRLGAKERILQVGLMGVGIGDR